MGDQDRLNLLADLSNRAVLEFEETQKKCKDFYEKFCHQHDRNQKLEAQFKQLKRVSLLAVSEYENLLKRYTDESKQKEDAQSKLKKVEEENKELRKANKFSPNVAIIPTSTEKDRNEGATKGELEGLRSLLTGMKDEIRRSKSQVSKAEEQLAEEKREHESTTKKLNAAHAQIQQLNKVSFMALDELSELKKKYDAEVECRKKAEEYATQLLHDNQSLTRKSRMLSDVAPVNEKLSNAIKEVENLNQTLSKERFEYTLKIKDLQEELDTATDKQALKVLEDKMTVTLDQIELLQSQLQESEQRAHSSERRAKELYDKLIRTEEALMSSAHPSAISLPPPPPPAPPPPPPIPAPMMRKFISRIGGGKKKKNAAEKEKDDPVQDMMKEMMSRIKKGVQLKSSAQKQDDENSPAMNELASLLTNLKRGQGGAEPGPAESAKEKVPEFQKFKLKKVSVPRERTNPGEQKADDELMRKLGKQKKAVEGEAAGEEGVSRSEEKSDSVHRLASTNDSSPDDQGPCNENESVPIEDNTCMRSAQEKKEDEKPKGSNDVAKIVDGAPNDIYENLGKPNASKNDDDFEKHNDQEGTDKKADVGDTDEGQSMQSEIALEKQGETAAKETAAVNKTNESETKAAEAVEEEKRLKEDSLDKSLDDIFDEINQFLG